MDYRFIRDEKYKGSKLLRITREVYEILREQKKEQKKSMSQITEDLIFKEYGKNK